MWAIPRTSIAQRLLDARRQPRSRWQHLDVHRGDTGRRTHLLRIRLRYLDFRVWIDWRWVFDELTLDDPAAAWTAMQVVPLAGGPKPIPFAGACDRVQGQ